MKLSIVIPTLGDIKLLSQAIKSINYDTNKFEILIINQGNEINLNLIDNNLKNIKISNVSFKGLSKAKNYAIQHCEYDNILFMDDDAEWLNETTEYFDKIDEGFKFDLLCGRTCDKNFQDTVKKFHSGNTKIYLDNFENKFIESAMIFKKKILQEFNFDEIMGAGEFFGAEEGYDIIFRILKSKNKSLYYDSRLVFYHPQPIVDHCNLKSIKRVYNYRLGYGYLCRKHDLKIKYYKRCILLILYLLFLNLTFNKKKLYYFTELCSLILSFNLSRKYLND